MRVWVLCPVRALSLRRVAGININIFIRRMPRGQEQLDIMLRMEASDRDPMAPEYIEQEILFMTKYWHVSRNRFPYEGAEQQF